MAQTKDISWDDTVLPFHLERSGVRGRVARTGPLLEHILSRHDYPVAVSAMETVTRQAALMRRCRVRSLQSVRGTASG